MKSLLTSSILSLIIVFHFETLVAAPPCYQTVMADANSLSRYLGGPFGTSDNPVVTPSGFRNGKVVFTKYKDNLWVSRHDAIPNTLTAEGDIRLPIFLFGPELAAKFGYAIREVGNNQIEIEIPDAEMYFQKVAKANQYLLSRKLEPITYVPIRTGFVTIKETIQIIRSAQGDYLVHFPYADRDFPLVTHEVAFHLGAILLNKKIIQRSREITDEFQLFIDMITEAKDEFGEAQANRLKGQLRIERNFEMEAGLASMVTSPGFSRRDLGMKPYSEILPRISARYLNYMLRNVHYLARPYLQPFEVVLTRLGLMTGVQVQDLVKNNNADFPTFSLPAQRIGIKVELNESQLATLRRLAVQYAQKERGTKELGAVSDWLDEWLMGLDKRIQDITNGL